MSVRTFLLAWWFCWWPLFSLSVLQESQMSGTRPSWRRSYGTQSVPSPTSRSTSSWWWHGKISHSVSFEWIYFVNNEAEIMGKKGKSLTSKITICNTFVLAVLHTNISSLLISNFISDPGSSFFFIVFMSLSLFSRFYPTFLPSRSN